MYSYFSIIENNSQASNAIPLTILSKNDFESWLISQDGFTKEYIKNIKFEAQAKSFCIIPNAQGKIQKVLLGKGENNDPWFMGFFVNNLPENIYYFENNEDENFQNSLAWGLGAYKFSRYKNKQKTVAKLQIHKTMADNIKPYIEAIYLVRDLINTPTNDMGPEELASATLNLAKEFSAEFSEIVGEDLLKENYPAIYAVGQASPRKSRLLELRWGEDHHPKITLVGKGVCFDTGGLNIKSSSNMSLMKKDMGGAAHVLGLAYLIMSTKLPVNLRVLIPAVENVISGNAYRPSDVIRTRKGLTVEIGNTDSEGRVVLSDALFEASKENPEIIIDFATLTGAARVALGTDIPVLFSNDDEIAEKIKFISKQENDLVWQLPLYKPYREYINSNIADINNDSASSYAGAITAALFLQEFVENIPWVHFDLMAWNMSDKTARPQGGEAMALRTVFAYLRERYNLREM